MKLITSVLLILLLSCNISGAQENQTCFSGKIALFTEKDRGIYSALRYIGFTQVCAVKIDTDVCSTACSCAYTAFEFLIESNPGQTEVLTQERTKFFNEFAQKLECPMF